MLTTRELQDEIIRLKKEKDICILAHAYQSQEILEVLHFLIIADISLLKIFQHTI